MNRKFTSLAGGLAVAALVVGGSVAASAAGSTQTEKVGYFEVQSKVNNQTPEAWFSEGDDDVAGLSITADGAQFAKSEKSVGINKIVDDRFDPSANFAIEATGTAKYSIVLTSDEVDYLRLTADDAKLNAETKWRGTGFFKDGERTPKTPTTISQTLQEWADAEAIWGAAGALEGAVLHQIGARHFSGEDAGSVKSLTYGDTTYVFTPTGFDQADIDAALKTVPAGYVAQSALDAADKKVADLEKKLAAAEKALAKAERATDKASDRALKAQARAPYRITGSAKVGKTLRAKGTSYKGVSVKYQWYVGGKKAGKKATLKLKKAHANKRVRVVVTKSYRDSARKKHTVKQTIHLTSKARAKR